MFDIDSKFWTEHELRENKQIIHHSDFILYYIKKKMLGHNSENYPNVLWLTYFLFNNFYYQILDIFSIIAATAQVGNLYLYK